MTVSTTLGARYHQHNDALQRVPGMPIPLIAMLNERLFQLLVKPTPLQSFKQLIVFSVRTDPKPVNLICL